MSRTKRPFIPAAGSDWLLPLYDPFQRWVLREETLKRALVDQVDIDAGHRILDIGCGTGSLTVLVKRLHPDAHVFGLDPDPKALARATQKAERCGTVVHFERGYSDRLPFADESLDAVVSSLMFHHLAREVKSDTLREARRTLRPGGAIHILDFGVPRSPYARAMGRVTRRAEHSRDNIEGRIPSLMSDSGFFGSEEVASRETLFGSLSYYRGFAPE